MPQLNDDGLPGFSANDWAAPVLTYLFLSLYADLSPPGRPPPLRADPRPGHPRVSLAVNVVTI